jgi:hypothetical protein
MTILRLMLALFGAAFGLLIVWAIAIGDFAAAGNWLTSDPWGIVTLADLYFGFLLSAVVIACMERNWRAALWIAPIPFLGNVWTVVWFIVRFPRLLGRRQPPESVET